MFLVFFCAPHPFFWGKKIVQRFSVVMLFTRITEDNLSDPKFSTTAVSRLQIRPGLLRGCLHIGACFMCVFSI